MEDDDATGCHCGAADCTGIAGGEERRAHQCRADVLLDSGARHALHGLRLFPRRAETSGDGLSMRVRYFAWVRERVGNAEEELDPPPGVTSIADLIRFLSEKDEGYAAAFAEPDVI